MCGISGFILKRANKKLGLEILQKMVSSLSHRGPDNKGFWNNHEQTQFVGHTRLSILDLSEKGNQPMISSSGQYIISYNGEIYNHLEIREYLKKKKNIKWRSSSDTETILEAISEMGIQETVSRLQGMFAFCVIDTKKNLLYLVRDKFGEKPLYYGFLEGNFIFASELKSILSFPDFKKKINKTSVNYFFNFSYIPEPLSIFENVFKLEAGKILTFSFNDNQIISNKKYDIFYDQENLNLNNENCLDLFDKTINTVVSDTMISDVEVGSFLSGGIDSSLITSIMQKQSNKKIKTFSVVFEDLKYDEKYYSRNISSHLNTEHNEILVNSKDLIELSKEMPDIYDEPFADSSQIPSAIISKFASNSVKVILSGDGADELFGGYNRYVAFDKINKFLKICPYQLRIMIGKVISLLPMNMLSIIENILGKIFLYNRSITQLDDKIKKLGHILVNSKSVSDMCFAVISITENTQNLLINENSKKEIDEFKDKIGLYLNNNNDLVENLMKFDQETYLTGDILHKVDRAAMHYSLETRIPFLNQKIVNFSNNLNRNMKIKGSNTKIILREVLKRYVPEKYVNRPKMGFSIPLSKWLSGPLKNWMLEAINFSDIEKQGYLNNSQIKVYLENHLSGKKDFSRELWNIIIFQKWLSKYN